METIYESNCEDLQIVQGRIGDRHPFMTLVGKAVIIAGVFTIVLLTLSFALTKNATAKQEFNAAKVHAHAQVIADQAVWYHNLIAKK